MGMRHPNFIPVLVLVCAMLLPLIAQSDSYRCGRKIVRNGDTSSELLRICGKPLHKDRGKARIRINGSMREASVQRWYYKKNARSLERIILIYKGNIAGIETGSR